MLTKIIMENKEWSELLSILDNASREARHNLNYNSMRRINVIKDKVRKQLDIAIIDYFSKRECNIKKQHIKVRDLF